MGGEKEERDPTSVVVGGGVGVGVGVGFGYGGCVVVALVAASA